MAVVLLRDIIAPLRESYGLPTPQRQVAVLRLHKITHVCYWSPVSRCYSNQHTHNTIYRAVKDKAMGRHTYRLDLQDTLIQTDFSLAGVFKK